MVKRVCIALCVTVTSLLSVNAAVPAPVADGERILWVGNSFSDWFGPINEVVDACFKAAGSPKNTTSHLIGIGMGTMQMYYRITSLRVVDSIRSGHFDKIVLQGWDDAYRIFKSYEGAYSESPAAFVEYGTKIMNEAKAKNMDMILFWPQFANWEWDDADKMKSAIASYESVARQTGALIAPANKAWQQVIADKGLEKVKTFIYHDVGHQNANGMLLNSFVLYTILTGGKSAEGLKAQWPDGIINGQTNGEPYQPDQQDYLARVAAKVGRDALGTTPVRNLTSANVSTPAKSKAHSIVLLNGRAVNIKTRDLRFQYTIQGKMVSIGSSRE